MELFLYSRKISYLKTSLERFSVYPIDVESIVTRTEVVFFLEGYSIMSEKNVVLTIGSSVNLSCTR